MEELNTSGPGEWVLELSSFSNVSTRGCQRFFRHLLLTELSIIKGHGTRNLMRQLSTRQLLERRLIPAELCQLCRASSS